MEQPHCVINNSKLKQVDGLRGDCRRLSQNESLGPEIFLPVVLTDVRSERHPILDCFITEGTVEHQRVDVIALDVFPRSKKSVRLLGGHKSMKTTNLT